MEANQSVASFVERVNASTTRLALSLIGLGECFAPTADAQKRAASILEASQALEEWRQLGPVYSAIDSNIEQLVAAAQQADQILAQFPGIG